VKPLDELTGETNMRTTISNLMKLGMVSALAVTVGMASDEDAYAGGGMGSSCDDFYVPEPEDPNDYDPNALALEFCTELVVCGYIEPGTLGTCIQDYLDGLQQSGGDPPSEGTQGGAAVDEFVCENSHEYYYGLITCSEVCGDKICQNDWEASWCTSDCAPAPVPSGKLTHEANPSEP
jgi:hypothetical protein